jgi:hypothetical protein
LWQFTKVPFTWYVALGSILTFAVGYTASMFFPEPEERKKVEEREKLHA